MRADVEGGGGEGAEVGEGGEEGWGEGIGGSLW